MSYKRRSAFTLIEVLIAVALTGLVASLALVPVVIAVQQVVEAEETYMDETALRKAASFMAQDVAGGLRMALMTIRLIDRSSLSTDKDILIVASAAPAKQNMSAGSVVYKLLDETAFRDRIPGLYRWILAGIMPDDIEPDKLDDEKGQLILPYVTAFDLKIWEDSDWTSEYDGKMPRGIKIALSRGEEKIENVYGFPQ